MSRFQPHTTNNSLRAGTIDNPPKLQQSTPAPMSSAQPESEQFPTDLDTQPGIQPIPAADQTDGEFLAQAINRIVKSNLPNKVKLREPDPFDGSDTRKLCTFILQCKLNF